MRCACAAVGAIPPETSATSASQWSWYCAPGGLGKGSAASSSSRLNSDAAPVTVDLEVRVGLQLARMFGYPDDPARPDCAFGHLTSGGTVANYQALRLALALKGFPVALRDAGVPDIELPEDDWAAFNLGPDASITLLSAWTAWLASLSAQAQASERPS